MTTRRHIAPIRFGLGLRLGEAPPADPLGWLEHQIASPAAAPEGPGVPALIRARHAANQEQRVAAAAAGATARQMEAADPGMGMAEEGREARRALFQIQREEQRAWAERRLTTPEPFRERLVDFWMNHFTVSRRRPAVATLVGAFEREAIRPHVTGRFEDILVAATRHPAMLLYLDNQVSRGPNSAAGRRAGRGLNENLAREVLELHTLSPAGGYTQGDVQELARILTGWSVGDTGEPWDFIWRPDSHEPGEKHLLGRRFAEGPDSQAEALRFLATRPATWRHLAVKLSRHFVADDPPPESVRAVEEALRRTGGDLGAAARALVALPAAWDPPLGKLRTPQDHVVATCRAAGIERGELVIAGLAATGQPLWSAAQPNGWPDRAADWAAPEALMRRVDWAHTLVGRLGRADVGAVAEAALGPLARAETVQAMRVAGSVRDSLTLLFGSPEFMRR